jgi:DNA helicase-2/ATP-dependent DNA helicase PcrA
LNNSNHAEASLNPAQREAVAHFEGPLLILAGAGSGKTRVLTMRIAKLIAERGVPPSEILAVTFTNKAAGEMRDRITALVGHKPPGMWVGTFHSLGARLLRLHAAAVSRTPAFTIYDQDDTLALIKRVVDSQDVTGDLNPRAVLAAISDAKNRLVGSSEYESLARDPFSRSVARVFAALNKALRASNAVSFDDLLTLPVEMLRGNPDILSHYQRRFRFILVDEYQDTNHAQYKFINLLGSVHQNVCVVGDDDQSIYGWRGADIRNILDFEKDFTGARIVRLEENYRSTPGILAAANAVIAQNEERRGKTLRATLPAGEKVTLTACLDERDEAEWMAGEIASRRARDGSLRQRDIVVIYRTNAQSRILEEVFRRRSIPYRLVGAVSFFERREVKDLLSYLRLIANPSDDVAFLRAVAAPRRGIGVSTLEHLASDASAKGLSLLAASQSGEITAGLRPAARVALHAFAELIAGFALSAQTASVAHLLGDIVKETGYDDFLRREDGAEAAAERLENVRELASSAAALADEDSEDEVGTELELFLQRSALIAQIDALDPTVDAVTLMTVHNAKGLEFPVVFISGLEDGLFPLARAHDAPALMEEERRLLYVGITRAERKLYLSYAASRRRNGELRQELPTKYIA